MSAPSSARALIAAMQPELDPETYCFVTMPEGYRSSQIAELALASFREEEGISFVLTLAATQAFFLRDDQPQRRIVLNVRSRLDAVGLTAAVSATLAQAGIPCNCVAAFHHDHVFVPERQAADALQRLKALQAEARSA